MNTFLPFPNFSKSVKSLDKRRCWKQCVEARQILNVLEGKSEGWKNHPAVKMWCGYDEALSLYYNICYFHSVNIHQIKAKKLLPISKNCDSEYVCVPSWLGNPEFHQSHINNLSRKAFEDLQKRNNNELWVALVRQGTDPMKQDIKGKYIWPKTELPLGF